MSSSTMLDMTRGLKRQVISVSTRAMTRKEEATKPDDACIADVPSIAYTCDAIITETWVKSLRDTTHRITL